MTDMPNTSSQRNELRPGDREQVACLLGREPKGLQAIQVRNHDGDPIVVRVASVVDGKPFPTLFWLVDPALVLAIDRLEAGGLIKQMEAAVRDDEELRIGLEADHRAYIQQREAYMTSHCRRALIDGGFYSQLGARGVGGVADFGQIRCLHMFYAAHLVRSNQVGLWLEREYL